jgi:ABC-type transporter Mla subunit MlaD
LSRKTEENTPKLTEANAKGDVAKSKVIVNNVARELTEFSERMNADMPIFSRSYSSAMDAVSKSATLWESDFNEDQSGVENTFAQIQDLVDGIETAKQSMFFMQQTIIKLPRLTALFNKGKKQASDALINFDRELNSALNLTREAQNELSRILQSKRVNITRGLSNEDAVMEIADYLRANVHPIEATLVRFEQLNWFRCFGATD